MFEPCCVWWGGTRSQGVKVVWCESDSEVEFQKAMSGSLSVTGQSEDGHQTIAAIRITKIKAWLGLERFYLHSFTKGRKPNNLCEAVLSIMIWSFEVFAHVALKAKKTQFQYSCLHGNTSRRFSPRLGNWLGPMLTSGHSCYNTEVTGRNKNRHSLASTLY